MSDRWVQLGLRAAAVLLAMATVHYLHSTYSYFRFSHDPSFSEMAVDWRAMSVATFVGLAVAILSCGVCWILSRPDKDRKPGRYASLQRMPLAAILFALTVSIPNAAEDVTRFVTSVPESISFYLPSSRLEAQPNFFTHSIVTLLSSLALLVVAKPFLRWLDRYWALNDARAD